MELENEPNIDWIQDPYGRRDQIQRQVRAADAVAQSVIDSLRNKIQAIVQLEDENREQIKTTAEKAYRAVENVVSILLTIQSGNHRLSRENASIIAILQDSVKNFEDLCTISRENKDELGIKAGDCKELGDGASRLGRTLGERAAEVRMEAATVRSSRGAFDEKWQTYHNDEENLRSQVRDKESSVDDIGNQFLGLFDSGVSDRLRRELRQAKERLGENLRIQHEAKNTSESYSQLAGQADNASSALLNLRQLLEQTSSDFASEFVKLSEAQNIEIDLWTGLLDLKNKIWSTDYVSTRDQSLRQLLDLLTLDDKVFMRQEFFENTEMRIKEAISKKLGADAVEKLIAGKFNLVINEGELSKW